MPPELQCESVQGQRERERDLTHCRLCVTRFMKQHILTTSWIIVPVSRILAAPNEAMEYHPQISNRQIT